MTLIVHQPQKIERIALSQQEAAEALGVSDTKIRAWTKQGKLHPMRDGKLVLYSVDDLKRFLSGKPNGDTE